MSCPERGEFAGSFSSFKTSCLGCSQPWHIPGMQGQAGAARGLHPPNSSPVSDELGQLLRSKHQREETGMEQGNEEIPDSEEGFFGK